MSSLKWLMFGEVHGNVCGSEQVSQKGGRCRILYTAYRRQRCCSTVTSCISASTVESRPWSKAAMQQASETKSKGWEAGPHCGCSSVTIRHTGFEYMFLFQAATGKIMWNPNANQFGPNISWAMHNIRKMSIGQRSSLASLTHSVKV